MKIHVYFTDMPFGFDVNKNCFMQALRKRHEVEKSEEPDFVFYSAFGTEFLRFQHAVRIFLAVEPVLPNFNDCDYAIGPFKLSFGERYFRTPPFLNYGEEELGETLWKERMVSQENTGRKFCNFVYSNAHSGEGAKLRSAFCQALSNYRHIDCPGEVLHNMEDKIGTRYHKNDHLSEKHFNGDWMQSKLNFLQDYKFSIAFENCAMSGWATEKLIHPLMAKSIPIYWGDPNVTEYFNEKAFVNCANYGNDFEAVIRRVIELDRNDAQYLEMLRQRPLTDAYPLHWKDGLADFLSSIIERGVRPFDKNPIGFPSMTAQDDAALCRDGKMGLRKIARNTSGCFKGWLDYKMNRGRKRKANGK